MRTMKHLSILAVALSLTTLGSAATKAEPKLTPEQIAAAATTVTGKLVFTATITVSSTIPAADVISCGAQATVLDTGSGNSIFETAAVAATRSGSTATCSVTIPYSWNLVTPTADFASLSFSVNVPATPATPAALLPNRVSSQTLGRIPVPPNGTTTTQTLKVTI